MNQIRRVGRFLLPLFCLFMVVAAVARAAEYLGPTDVVAAPDGKSLFVLCADAKAIIVIDPAGKEIGRIAMPERPTGLVAAPGGTTLYVTCADPEGVVYKVDAAGGRITGTMDAGHGATGPALSPDGRRLYVCNRFDNDVSVFDLENRRELARIPATREPIAAVVTPDGKKVLVANHLPLDPADGYDVAAVVTVIDSASGKTSSLRLPNGATGLREIAISPDGKYAAVPHLLARYQMPTTQLERGWMNTNALTILEVASASVLNTVLLDDVDLGAANPWGVAWSADGKMLCVSHAGTHELSVIEAPALLEKLAAMPKTREEAEKRGIQAEDNTSYASLLAEDVPNDLAYLVKLRRRVKLPGNGPRGLALLGAKAFVAEYFSDALALVPLEANPSESITTLALGPEPVLTPQRLGQRHFHDAALCFQHWQSCASCHPDGRVDGLNWDLMNDGLGNPKNTKTMLLAHQTPPAMSSGVRADAEVAVRSGITHIQFAVRPEEDARAIDAYLKTLQPVRSPRLVEGRLSESARRGKELFHGDAVGCHLCHPTPLYTDLKTHDVESKGTYDRREDYDTPTLIEVWRTAPYMHDGKYTTIKDLIVQGRHGETGGDLKKLTDEQIDDLVEYVLSL